MSEPKDLQGMLIKILKDILFNVEFRKKEKSFPKFSFNLIIYYRGIKSYLLIKYNFLEAPILLYNEKGKEIEYDRLDNGCCLIITKPEELQVFLRNTKFEYNVAEYARLYLFNLPKEEGGIFLSTALSNDSTFKVSQEDLEEAGIDDIFNLLIKIRRKIKRF